MGYAFAFGEGSPYIGLTYFSCIGLDASDYSKFFFQVKLKEKITYLLDCNPIP